MLDATILVWNPGNYERVITLSPLWRGPYYIATTITVRRLQATPLLQCKFEKESGERVVVVGRHRSNEDCIVKPLKQAISK